MRTAAQQRSCLPLCGLCIPGGFVSQEMIVISYKTRNKRERPDDVFIMIRQFRNDMREVLVIHTSTILHEAVRLISGHLGLVYHSLETRSKCLQKSTINVFKNTLLIHTNCFYYEHFIHKMFKKSFFIHIYPFFYPHSLFISKSASGLPCTFFIRNKDRGANRTLRAAARQRSCLPLCGMSIARRICITGNERNFP